MEGPNLFIDQGLPVKFSHFSAGGQFFEQPISLPTRMIVTGPEIGASLNRSKQAQSVMATINLLERNKGQRQTQ